ncbi:MAG: hypothetical protein ACI4VF_04435 [Lachnospirales bacterium]
MNNISYKQYQALTLIVLVTVNFIMISFITTSLISIITGLFLSFLYGLIFLMVKNKVNYNLFTSYVLSLKYIVTSSSLIAIFTKITLDIFVKDVNKYVMLIIIFLAASYCAVNNDAIYRIGRILYIFILIPIISVIIFSFGDIKLNNIVENFNIYSLKDIFYISFTSLIFEITGIFTNFYDHHFSLRKYVIPTLFSIFIIIVAYICVVGRLGASSLKYSYPSFELMYSSDMSDLLIKRQEGILISMFLMGLLTAISLYMYFSISTKVIFKNKFINLMLIFILSALIIFTNKPYLFFIVSNFIGGIILLILMFLSRSDKSET